MRTYFDCIPCFVRQGLDSVKLITNDEAVQEQVLREVLRLTSEMDLCETPPAMAQKIHRIIRQLIGTNDPYEKAKRRFNEFALELFPKMQEQMIKSERPFETAVRLAIAGNIVDLGVKCSLEIQKVEKEIDDALEAEFDMTDLDDFQTTVAEAKDILYITDNAGEIVFDRLLVEQIGPEKITFVVRGGPIINDATIEDAQAAGLMDLVKVIDTGDDAPGTILESCSKDFQRRFEAADLVIAKGQGNYETLSDVDKNTFFLVKAKCPVIARDLGCEVGEMILRRNQSYSNAVDLVKEAE